MLLGAKEVTHAAQMQIRPWVRAPYTVLGTDGELLNAGSGTWTLAGNLKAEAPVTMVRAANGPIQIPANLSGAGSMLHVNNTVTLSGSNGSFTGKTLVGDGRFGGLAIDSEARLGANPVSFTIIPTSMCSSATS